MVLLLRYIGVDQKIVNIIENLFENTVVIDGHTQIDLKLL